MSKLVAMFWMFFLVVTQFAKTFDAISESEAQSAFLLVIAVCALYLACPPDKD